MADMTPGPWYAHRCVGLPDEDWWEVDTLEKMPTPEALADYPRGVPPGYRDVCILPRRSAQDEANAVAIAALPELLAAAEALLDDRVRATLAKAPLRWQAPLWERLRLAVAAARAGTVPV